MYVDDFFFHKVLARTNRWSQTRNASFFRPIDQWMLQIFIGKLCMQAESILVEDREHINSYW